MNQTTTRNVILMSNGEHESFSPEKQHISLH